MISWIELAIRGSKVVPKPLMLSGTITPFRRYCRLPCSLRTWIDAVAVLDDAGRLKQRLVEREVGAAGLLVERFAVERVLARAERRRDRVAGNVEAAAGDDDLAGRLAMRPWGTRARRRERWGAPAAFARSQVRKGIAAATAAADKVWMFMLVPTGVRRV